MRGSRVCTKYTGAGWRVQTIDKKQFQCVLFRRRHKPYRFIIARRSTHSEELAAVMQQRQALILQYITTEKGFFPFLRVSFLLLFTYTAEIANRRFFLNLKTNTKANWELSSGVFFLSCQRLVISQADGWRSTFLCDAENMRWKNECLARGWIINWNCRPIQTCFECTSLTWINALEIHLMEPAGVPAKKQNENGHELILWIRCG